MSQSHTQWCMVKDGVMKVPHWLQKTMGWWHMLLLEKRVSELKHLDCRVCWIHDWSKNNFTPPLPLYKRKFSWHEGLAGSKPKTRGFVSFVTSYSSVCPLVSSAFIHRVQDRHVPLVSLMHHSSHIIFMFIFTNKVSLFHGLSLQEQDAGLWGKWGWLIQRNNQPTKPTQKWLIELHTLDSKGQR